jgi:hypothetical protein
MCLSLNHKRIDWWGNEGMDYLKYEEEIDGHNGFTYLEIEEGYAIRQIFVSNSFYIVSNRKDDEYGFWLTEGFINIGELEGVTMTISSKEFYEIWSAYKRKCQNEWDNIKQTYRVGAKVNGNIECFYPQGVIVSIDVNAVAIAGYNECKNSTTPEKLYPKHKIEAIVNGYDEENMWLILEKSKVVD